MTTVDAFPENAGSRYEPPAIETVLTAASLSREIHYAGQETCIPDDTDNACGEGINP